MAYNVAALQKLIEQFERMPGIGHKSAQRMAFYVLSLSQTEAKAFADDIENAHSRIHRCKVCCNLTENEICSVCADPSRSKDVICVVEDPRDVIAIERTHEFNGTYHVLHGVISPLSGIGPSDLTVKELLARADGTREMIMAMNPTVEGDATALYISKLVKPLGIKTTRLAYGIPVGADLEYADDVTLSRAMEGRREM
jgi:recombination protein RecR